MRPSDLDEKDGVFTLGRARDVLSSPTASTSRLRAVGPRLVSGGAREERDDGSFEETKTGKTRRHAARDGAEIVSWHALLSR